MTGSNLLTFWAGEALTSSDFRQGSDHLVCFETGRGRVMQLEVVFPVAVISCGTSFPKERVLVKIALEIVQTGVRTEPGRCFGDTSGF
jgi:hypothetical protein